MRAAIIGVVAILLLGSGLATAGELIVNGGFENGFNGWTVSGVKVFSSGQYAGLPCYGITHAGPHSGASSAWFGCVDGLTFISQIISTVPGDVYDASFWVENYNGDLPAQNEIQVFWGGTQKVEATNVRDTPWYHFHGTLVATQDQTELKFGFYNVPGWWNLDDVSISTPEPGTLMLCGTLLGLLALCRKRLGAPR